MEICQYIKCKCLHIWLMDIKEANILCYHHSTSAKSPENVITFESNYRRLLQKEKTMKTELQSRINVRATPKKSHAVRTTARTTQDELTAMVRDKWEPEQQSETAIKFIQKEITLVWQYNQSTFFCRNLFCNGSTKEHKWRKSTFCASVKPVFPSILFFLSLS